jgi:hypothetical protein
MVYTNLNSINNGFKNKKKEFQLIKSECLYIHVEIYQLQIKRELLILLFKYGIQPITIKRQMLLKNLLIHNIIRLLI